MLDLEAIENASPASLASCFRETLIGRQIAPDRYAVLDADLVAAEGGDARAWDRLAAAIWKTEALYAECDAVPGLRSRIRKAAIGGIFEAISALIGRSVRLRDDDYAQAISVVDGKLWIPDAIFHPFVYFLELNPYGLSPCWDERMSDLIEQPGGSPAVWRRWLAWAGQGQAVRGYLSMPGLVGSLPAWGIPERQPAVKGLSVAVRATPSARPVLVADRPILLAWGMDRDLEAIDRMVAQARSIEERRAISVPWTPSAYRGAMQTDPLLAMAANMARTGQRRPVMAVMDLVRRGVLTMAALGQPERGVLVATIPAMRPSGRVRVAAWGDRLCVDPDGLAAVITWLGLFPARYTDSPTASCAWDFATLQACGWSALGEARRWDVAIGEDGLRWVVFPPGSGGPSLPDMQGLRLTSFEAAAACAMTTDARWEPPAEL